MSRFCRITGWWSIGVGVRFLNHSGKHALTLTRFETPYVLVAVRLLVDSNDPADVAVVNALQDEFTLTAGSAQPFVLSEYDESSLDATRQALLELAKGLSGFDRAFGPREGVDPVRHLIATAAGWGGLPEEEAYYLNVNPGLRVGEHHVMVRDVPVDGFWSISLYNADGYFQANDRNAYSINNLTATPNADGSVTVNFGGCGNERPNCLPIMDGWNYVVRL